MTIEPGTRVTDKVRLVRLLDAGSMGEVWVGFHEMLQTEVAVKFVSEKLLEKIPNATDRFSVEAAAAARIKSPHVVRTFDHGHMDDGTPYIVMELMEGENIDERLTREGPLSLELTGEIIKQAGLALDAAHQAGVIHRDIKPQNVFLMTTGGGPFVKVLDFGSARQPGTKKGSRLTLPGMLVGTPEYISRDLLLDSAALTPHADLWGLAAVAYKCLTGRVPFSGDTVGEICDAIIEGKMKRPSRLREDLPPALDVWFAHCFAVERSDRPQSGADMASAFDKLVREISSQSLEPLPPSPAQRLRERLSLAALGVGLLLAAVAFVVFQLRRSEPASATGSANPTTAQTATGAAQPSSTPTATSTSATSVSPPATAAPTSSATAPVSDIATRERAAPSMIARLEAGRIVIPAGPFWMGCDDKTDRDCEADERPGREVTLPDFAIDRTEVTVKDFSACVDAGACSSTMLKTTSLRGETLAPSHRCNWGQDDRLEHPINCVDHDQAVAFCLWVRARLPTEAEWEKAARGEDRRRYPWTGDSASCTLAVVKLGGAGCRAEATLAVGSRTDGASPYGLLDMAGNVREWVADWYAPDYYRDAPGENPRGPSEALERSMRGGGWGTGMDRFLRTAKRDHAYPKARLVDGGFRCAATVKP